MGILLSKPGNIEKFKEDLEKQLEIAPIYPSPDAKVIKTQSRRPTKPAPQAAQKIELNAEPNGKNEYQISAFDGRTQILETRKWPNSVHGVVVHKVKNRTIWGTGIMIGPKIVLTAGHNLYDRDTRFSANSNSLQFLPGMNGKTLPFGLKEVDKSFVSPNYIKEGKEDYGIMILKEPIGEETGYFGLACLEPKEIEEKIINITGYPGDKVADKVNIFEMWGMEGKASSIDQNLGHINYLIDTGPGQSGSGVWYQEGEDYYVCGVHKTGEETMNTATLLTRAMYRQIYTWLQQAGFKESLLTSKETQELQFWNQEIDAECVSHLIKDSLSALKTLQLWQGKIGNKEAKILAQNTSWNSLSELNLIHNKIGAEGARALAQNSYWTSLSRLNLSSNKIVDEGARELAKNTSWNKLSWLDLSNNDIGAEGAKALAKNTSWNKLSVLDLSNNKIGAEGAEALAENISWSNLSVLDLSYNNIEAGGAKALAQDTSRTNLSVLILSHNNISEEGAKELALCKNWANLSVLNLSGNNIGAEGAKAIAQKSNWIKLSRLDLPHNNIGAEGAKALAQNTNWVNLSLLNLSDNNIGEKGAEALAQNTSWINLKLLYLVFNNIGTEEAKVLSENASWVNLKQLYLWENNADSEVGMLLTQYGTLKRKYTDIF